MSVEKIMSEGIVTVEMDDPLKVIKDIFDHTRFHHLPVVDSEKLVGIISDRDLLKSLGPNIGTVAETTKDAISLNKRAHQIMTREPVTISPGAAIFDAINIFNNHNISCIPVGNHENRPIGIISWRDILKIIEETHNNNQPPQ